MSSINATIQDLASELGSKGPKEIIRHALENHGKVAVSFSGAEDVVLIEMATQVSSTPVHVFSLDTGRLHAETYQFIEKVREHYGDRIRFEVTAPDTQALEKLVREKGLYSFYTDGHKECCGIRKVQPLKRKLSELDAWITGQRRDQSPTRAEVPVVQIDPLGGDRDPGLVKFNPLAGWSSKQVWDYITLQEIPYNALHERGYISIGCEPCTRPVRPGEHERAGRWWWEEATQAECGLHAVNIEK